METILLFAPLVGAVICGFGHKIIGEKAAMWTATGLLFLTALLSWVVFLSFDGETRIIEIFRWIESGSLSTSWAIRLDRLTTGLLLFTNDGEMAKKLTHPSHNIKKVYQVLLDKPITQNDFNQIAEGLTLEDGPAPVDDLAVISPDNLVLGIEIHIGRNRIVRRIFEHLGYTVVKLDRVVYADLTKKDLPRGKWRFLTQKRVINLR